MSAERTVRRRAAVLLLAAAVLAAVRFYRARHYLDFVDESVEATTAWLVSEGETLYGSIFSHHMPLQVAAGHLVAAISPTDRPEHFRVAPFLAYLLAALAIARSPFERARPGSGRLAAGLFLLAVAAVGPNVWGHMLLADPLWACAFVVLAVSFVLPVLFGLAPSRRDAALAGAGAVLALSGSLIAAYPLVLAALLCAVALADPDRRRPVLSALPAFCAGALAAFAGLAAWVALFGSPSGFVEEALRFNRDVYYKFTFGEARFLPSVFADWSRWVRAAPALILGGDLDAWFLPIGILAAAWAPLAAARARPAAGRRASFLLAAETVVWCLLVASLRMRNGGFHALPYYLAVLCVLSLAAARGLAARRQVAVGLAAALAFGPAIVFAARDARAWSNPRAGEWESGSFGSIARHVRRHTRPDERFAAFPFPSYLYLEARRRPATDSVYYFPWQAAWERGRPGRPDTCAQLRRSPPRFVFVWPVRLWDRFRWEEWGACVDAFVRSRYTRLPQPEFDGLLWELRPEQ